MNKQHLIVGGIATLMTVVAAGCGDISVSRTTTIPRSTPASPSASPSTASVISTPLPCRSVEPLGWPVVSVSQLTVAPDPPVAGTPFQVRAQVGYQRPISCAAVLQVALLQNGVRVGLLTLSSITDRSQEVVFTHTITQPGQHTLSVTVDPEDLVPERFPNLSPHTVERTVVVEANG